MTVNEIINGKVRVCARVCVRDCRLKTSLLCVCAALRACVCVRVCVCGRVRA